MTPRRRLRYRTLVRQTLASWGWTRHLIVERVDGRGGIPWEDLQALKDEALGVEACAVEFYPTECEVVNEINRRHLWEIPDGLMVPPLSRRDS
jgi:hypothetical protein